MPSAPASVQADPSLPREHTEQLEYDRALGVLRDAFGANEPDDSMAVGALFARTEAIRYALEIDV